MAPAARWSGALLGRHRVDRPVPGTAAERPHRAPGAGVGPLGRRDPGARRRAHPGDPGRGRTGAAGPAGLLPAGARPDRPGLRVPAGGVPASRLSAGRVPAGRVPTDRLRRPRRPAVRPAAAPGQRHGQGLPDRRRARGAPARRRRRRGHLRLQPGGRHDQRDLPLRPPDRPAEQLPVRAAHRGPGRSRSASPSATASTCRARPSSRGGGWRPRTVCRWSRSPG